MRRRHLGSAAAVAAWCYGCRLVLGIGDVEDVPASTPEREGGLDGGLSMNGSEGGGPTTTDAGGDGARADASIEGGSFLPPCTDWCWENPLPQGNDLRGVWADAPNDIWAVGEKGATVHWDGTSFQVRTRLPLELQKVWAPNAAIAFGLGNGNGPFIARYDGGTWGPSYMLNPPTGTQVFDLTGTNGEVFGVGSAMEAAPSPIQASAIRLVAGSSTWSSLGSPWDASAGPPTLRTVRGVGKEVWAAAPGRLAVWDGSWKSGSCEFFKAASCPGEPRLAGEGPGDPTALWLVSYPGLAVSFSRYDGVAWKTIAAPSYTGPAPGPAAATTVGDVWFLASTSPQSAYRFRANEGLAGPMTLPAPAQYSDIASYGPTQVIAVGNNGAIARFDGNWKAWPGTGGARSNLVDVCVSGGVALAVGTDQSIQNAVVVRRGADGLFAETSYGTAKGNTQSCWLASPTDQFLVAQDIFRRVGPEEKKVSDFGSSVSVRQIRGDAASMTVWAVGTDTGDGSAAPRGYAARLDDARFVEDSPPSAKELFGVWVDPRTHDAWAVGGGSTVFHRDTTGWKRIDPSPTPVTLLLSVSGTSNDDVWVSGNDLVAHWNGASWQTYHPKPPQFGTPLWTSIVAGPSGLWVLGSQNIPQHLDSAVSDAWSSIVGPPDLASLAFDRDGTLWGAGARGALLRHGP